MTDHEIHFGTLHEDGTVTDERRIRQADVQKCSHFILSADHYREDGTCRCDDPDAAEMGEWGYTWSEAERRWL